MRKKSSNGEGNKTRALCAILKTAAHFVLKIQLKWQRRRRNMNANGQK